MSLGFVLGRPIKIENSDNEWIFYNHNSLQSQPRLHFVQWSKIDSSVTPSTLPLLTLNNKSKTHKIKGEDNKSKTHKTKREDLRKVRVKRSNNTRTLGHNLVASLAVITQDNGFNLHRVEPRGCAEHSQQIFRNQWNHSKYSQHSIINS